MLYTRDVVRKHDSPVCSFEHGQQGFLQSPGNQVNFVNEDDERRILKKRQSDLLPDLGGGQAVGPKFSVNQFKELVAARHPTAIELNERKSEGA